MRKVIEMQMKLGDVPIENIEFDLRSRDEIPKVLIGLQRIYCNTEIRDMVFKVLIDLIPEDVDPDNGRSGMDLWKILVLGTIRLSCNWDYDKLVDIANNHRTLQLMLGHGYFDCDYRYALQTVKDNVSLFTPEVIDRINHIVVEYGHEQIGKKADGDLRGSCDSFVVETDVHHPTDINVLFDAMRKMIVVIIVLCGHLDLSVWRQGAHHLKKVKKLFRKASMLKRSTSKNPKKKAKREQLIIKAHMAYIELAQYLIDRVRETISVISSPNIMVQFKTGLTCLDLL